MRISYFVKKAHIVEAFIIYIIISYMYTRYTTQYRPYSFQALLSHRNLSSQTCVVCKFVDTKRLFRISQTAYIFSKNYQNMIANLANCHGDKRITKS